MLDKSSKIDSVKYTKITEGLSRYSWDNDNRIKLRELTAEAYAEFKNNPKPRDIAKFIGNRIKEKQNGN